MGALNLLSKFFLPDERKKKVMGNYKPLAAGELSLLFFKTLGPCHIFSRWSSMKVFMNDVVWGGMKMRRVLNSSKLIDIWK